MHQVRESSFQCQFESPEHRRVAHVRAWDAEEALQLFVAELRDDGIGEEGDVIVSAPSGSGSRARLRRHLAA